MKAYTMNYANDERPEQTMVKWVSGWYTYRESKKYQASACVFVEFVVQRELRERERESERPRMNERNKAECTQIVPKHTNAEQCTVVGWLAGLTVLYK